MNVAALVSPLRLGGIASDALAAAVRLWFIVAIAGHAIFAYYIVAFYGGTALKSGMHGWNANRLLQHGIVAGDVAGNLFFAGHVALAAIITSSGPLQLIPRMRARFAGFHRWNGRLYIAVAMAISVIGLYLVLARGTSSALMAAGNCANALLILLCATMTLRHALRREFEAHRRWALRTFLMVSGVWFMRLAFGFWIVVNGGAPGHTPDFDGPFDIFLALGHFAVPLLVLELYLHARARSGPAGQLAMAAGLFALGVATAVGIFGASLLFWRPVL